jgi:hypothetical protein
MANQYCVLMEESGDPESLFQRALGDTGTDFPILFVFDNFETVQSPVQLFQTLRAYVRLPNKVLMTTRHLHHFTGGYSIQVSGMGWNEFKQLVETSGSRLGITTLLREHRPWVEDLHDESQGHPYIVKVALGQVARSRRLRKFERLVAGMEDILRALFERSWEDLSFPAKRVFLLLCSWRSVVPEAAVHAVLLRSVNRPRIPFEDAVEELSQTSMIDRLEGDAGGGYLNVPATAFEFGKVALTASPDRIAIASDAKYLRLCGTMRPDQVSDHEAVGFVRYFRAAVEEAARGECDAQQLSEIGDFLANRYVYGWRHAAGFYDGIGNLSRAREAMHRFMTTSPAYVTLDDREFLTGIYRRLRDLREVDELVNLINGYLLQGRFGEASAETAVLSRGIVCGRLSLDGQARSELVYRLVVQQWNRWERRATEDDCNRIVGLLQTMGPHLADDSAQWKSRAAHRPTRRGSSADSATG